MGKRGICVYYRNEIIPILIFFLLIPKTAQIQKVQNVSCSMVLHFQIAAGGKKRITFLCQTWHRKQSNRVRYSAVSCNQKPPDKRFFRIVPVS